VGTFSIIKWVRFRLTKTYTGMPVATVDFVGEKINDHHIFPTNVKGLNPDKSTEFEECRDSILNRTLLFDETNKKIGNRKPSEYLKDLMEKGWVADRHKLELLMEAHLVSPQALDYLFANDFDAFIAEREKIMKRHILSLIHGR